MADETSVQPYRRSFGPSTVIFNQGEVGDCAYVIESGHVEIFSYRGGSELTLACLGEGELFGEMALIDQRLRSATARTLEAATLIVIRRDQVRDKIEGADPVLRLFLRVMLERLRATNAMIDLLRHAPEEAEAPPGVDSTAAQVRLLAMAQLKLEHELRQALEQSQIEVHLQAIVRVADGVTAGFEALARWRHPERGLVQPAEFITLAEETGIIVPMGLSVLAAACRDLLVLEQHMGRPLFMSVNLSPRQIAEPDLVTAVARILTTTGVEPAKLKLEVTESVLMEDPEATATVLNELKELGLQLAVDDFGTGYSSLAYLHRFPIDVVKVDRSFVGSMHEDDSNAKIVRGIVSLSRELGMSVIAEGVERAEQLELIRALRCEYAQGYLFARPLPLERILEGRDAG